MAGQHIKSGVIHNGTVIDTETGEVISENEKKFQYVAGDPGNFVFVYTALLNIISEWKLSQAGTVMLAYLLEKYANGTIFSISKALREELARRSGKSETTFYNTTRELLKLKLIVEVSYRAYKLNPKYAFRGTRLEQKKAVFEILQICKNC